MHYPPTQKRGFEYLCGEAEGCAVSAMPDLGRDVPLFGSCHSASF